MTNKKNAAIASLRYAGLLGHFHYLKPKNKNLNLKLNNLMIK